MSIESLMIMFILIEMFQVAFILVQVYQSKKMIERVVADPEFAGTILSNAIHGFIAELAADPKKQEAVAGVVSWMGSAILAGATGGGTPAKPVKLPGMLKIFEPFVNNPAFQGMIMQKAGTMLEKTGTAAGKKAVNAVADSVWGL